MHSLVRFANIAAGGAFTTADLYPPALDALGQTEAQYSLASFRYDLSKLRHQGLVEKVPRSRRYRLAGKGYPSRPTWLFSGERTCTTESMRFLASCLFRLARAKPGS